MELNTTDTIESKNPESRNALEALAVQYEYGEKLTKFTILVDFLKQGMQLYYQYKSKEETMPIAETKLLMKKYDELKDYFKNLL